VNESTGDVAMDDRPMTRVVDACFSNARDNPEDLARWLAAEVLLTDPVALEDDTLAQHLLALQDRIEALARVRYGVPLGEQHPPSMAR
jgi:hypothetical protein